MYIENKSMYNRLIFSSQITRGIILYACTVSVSMDYEEFKRQLGKAGISGREFSRIVKLNPNSLTNYAKTGKIPAHWAIIAALMGEMAEKGLDFKAVINEIDLEPNKVRGAAQKGKFGGTN